MHAIGHQAGVLIRKWSRVEWSSASSYPFDRTIECKLIYEPASDRMSHGGAWGREAGDCQKYDQTSILEPLHKHALDEYCLTHLPYNIAHVVAIIPPTTIIVCDRASLCKETRY